MRFGRGFRRAKSGRSRRFHVLKVATKCAHSSCTGQRTASTFLDPSGTATLNLSDHGRKDIESCYCVLSRRVRCDRQGRGRAR